MSINIIIKNAIKRYGDTVIIPDLSLEIKQGEFLHYSALPAAVKQPCCV